MDQDVKGMIATNRKEARDNNERYYFTGKWCKNNHIDVRLTSNGSCIQCKEEERKLFRKNNIEKTREYCNQYRLRNPEYFKNRDSLKIKNESYTAKQKRIERSREYYKNNKERMDKTNKLYRKNEKINNPDAEKIRTKTYRKNHPERIANLDRFRRAVKHDVKAERIIRLKVFERDGWICQICGKDVDKYAKVPNKRTPTIDHIISLIKGGSHTYDNVQLACYVCNCRKGNR